MDQEKIGKFIAQARKERGLTQDELALKLGLTAQAVSKWERGLNVPDMSLLESLAEVLNVDVLEILHGEKNPSSQNNDSLKDKKTTHSKKELSTIDKTIIDSITYYNHKTTQKYHKICFTIFLIFIAIIFVISILYSINNYNKIKVYSISSNNTLELRGKILFNPHQKSIYINSISYNDENTGTTEELQVKGISITISSSTKLILKYENIFSESNELNTINYYLKDINFESSVTDNAYEDITENYITEEDLKDLKLILEYTTANNETISVEYPLNVSQEFTNNKIFY